METAIMKSLLDEFLEDVVMTSDQLAEIELFILYGIDKFKYVHSPEVVETAQYLKTLAEENELTSSAALLNLLQTKKKKYNRFLWDLMDDRDTNSIRSSAITVSAVDSSQPLEGSVSIGTLIYPDLNSYEVHSYVKTLVHYYRHTIHAIREQFSEYRQVRLHRNGISYTPPTICKQAVAIPAKRSVVRYFEEFSAKDNDNEIVIWTRPIAQKYVFENRIDRSAIADNGKLMIFHSKPFENCQQGITHLYDNIVAHIQQEQPIEDQTVKDELVEWLFYSKMPNTEARPDCTVEGLTLGDQLRLDLSTSLDEDLHHFISWRDARKAILAQKQWKVLKSPPGHAWLASDNPGFGISLDDLYNRPAEMVADGSLTDIRPDTIIYYPISSEYCLRIQPFTGDQARRRANRHAAIEFEQSTIEELEVVNGLTFSTKKEMVVGRDKKSFEQLELI